MLLDIQSMLFLVLGNVKLVDRWRELAQVSHWMICKGAVFY
jgi:hypothetical protein